MVDMKLNLFEREGQGFCPELPAPALTFP